MCTDNSLRLGVLPIGWQRHADLLRAAHGHSVYRLTIDGQSLVLKIAAERQAAEGTHISHEITCYLLLQHLGVPTVRLAGHGPGWLLLEDLDACQVLRLARPADLAQPATGAAVAGWYRSLHAAGRRLLSQQAGAGTWAGEVLANLSRETDVLTLASLRDTAIELGGAMIPGWALVMRYIEQVKLRLATLPSTLTYNDFDVGNLALARTLPEVPEAAASTPSLPSRSAIVFDYHLLGIGLAYSDVRNVLGSLRGAARQSFQLTYGPTEPREELYDRPLGILIGLHHASRRPKFPAWAAPLVKDARQGVLEQCWRELLDVELGSKG